MSSMVQDAYDMGLTTSLGGMPKSSLYDDYNDYDDEFDDFAEDSIANIEINILKLNINKKRAVLHNDKDCVGDTGNIIKFNSLDDYNQFILENLCDYEISNCPLCTEDEESKTKQTSLIEINEDEIPF